MKALRDVDGVLAGHRVGDQQDLMRLDGAAQAPQLVHQFLVDLQAPGGVEDDRVVAGGLGARQGAAADLDRVLGLASLQHRHTDLRAEHAQLFHRGRPPHVSRDQQRMALAFILEKPRELRRRSGFARALQPDQHDLDRRLDLEVQLARAATHHLAQFDRDEADEVLLGRQRRQHFLAERLVLDVLDEVADDPDIDVGLEQSEADFAQRLFDIALADPALALEFFENAFEAVA